MPDVHAAKPAQSASRRECFCDLLVANADDINAIIIVAPNFMRYSQSPTVETSPVGDRVVLYDNASRKAVVLNPTGAWLWEQLSTQLSADELVQKLQARFMDVDAGRLRADVETCLRDLTQQQLLREEA